MAGSEEADTGKLPALVPEGGAKSMSVNIAGIPIPFRRTFSAVDRLLALPVEALSDFIENKLKGNIDTHIDAVQEKRRRVGKPDKLAKPSVKTVKALGEWAASAAEVDSKERDLSAVWRSVLDRILDEKDDAEELLRTMKSLPSSDIRYFLRCYSHNQDSDTTMIFILGFSNFVVDLASDHVSVSRLKESGLLTGLVRVPLIAVLVVTSGILFYAANSGFGSRPWNTDALQLIVECGGLAALILFVLSRLHKPTPLGKRLCEGVREYSRR
jgi:hypothetical protein